VRGKETYLDAKCRSFFMESCERCNEIFKIRIYRITLRFIFRRIAKSKPSFHFGVRPLWSGEFPV